MMKYRINLSYDGTHYSGWAIQPNSTSIQQLIQEVLQTILGVETPIIGSGRTDAGVHARLQVAHFSHPENLNLSSLHYSLNEILPKDIRIHEILPVDEEFHARFSVKKKIYRYYLLTVQDLFNYRYAYYVDTPLNLDLLKKALPLLVGTHDFSAFASSGCGAKNPVKTLYQLDILALERGFCLLFEGDGFLYKMVRNITGTLLEIATHKRSLEDLQRILTSKDRTQAGQTAPAHALFLHHVEY
ncbi:MAG: tRNA pseudouridine(38-40) synthase TruA [Candidatus Neptunochlamydia sp.]|nr:tRNA pseudouridine(38-40) synthase TruA [Candidatus Neptunochlamydia sp.]